MALDSNQIRKVYITRLVNSLVPPEFGEEYTHSVTNELLRATELGPKSQTNSQDIINQFKRMLLSRGDTTQWHSFQTIVESLLSLKSPEQVNSYLVFLAELSGMEISGPISSHQKPSQRISLGIPEPTRASLNRPINLQSSPYIRSTQPLSPPLSQPNYPMDNYITMDQMIKPYYETLDEDIILQYLPYTLVGIDSKLFKFIKAKDTIRIEIPNNINNSYSSILSKILEPGLLYVKLRELPRYQSPIKTSFTSILDKELNEYSNFINNIFAKPSTLVTIYNELYVTTLKLRLFYSLTRQLSLSGYEFLTKVYDLSKFDDDVIRELSNEIFSKISKPYYDILENWIIKGDLTDTESEFFIEINNDKTNINEALIYLPEKVPKFFVNKDLGFKIFQIGKILIFLKYCKELKWVNDYVSKYSEFAYNGLENMNINTLNQLINNQYKELVNYLTYVIHGKYELLHHLTNLKKFLLMGSNDFIDSIIIKGFSLFNEPSSQLTSNQLFKILAESIQFSSIKNYNIDTKNRLDARILDLSHGNIGWQVFTLEYRINDLPISNILDPGNLEYLKFFNFIWKLKQFQYFLNSNYVESNGLKRNELRKFKKSKNLTNYRNAYVLQAFKTINLIRSKFIKFLNLIVEYLSNETETNFNNLILVFNNEKYSKTLQVSNDFKALLNKNYNLPLTDLIDSEINNMDFDELVTTNMKYVKSFNLKILDVNVVAKSGEPFIDQIYKILEIIFKFIKSNEEFNNIISQYVALLNIEENLDKEDIDNELNYYEVNLKRIVDKIYKEVYSEFSYGYGNFVKDLKADFDLREFARLF